MCVCAVRCHVFAGPVLEPIDIALDVGDASGTDGDAGLAVT